MLGLACALTLGAISIARTYYVDNLPAAVQSPQAANVIINTVLRYLVGALQTLLVATVIALVALLLAGPSRPAKAIRHLVNRGLDFAARGLARAGSWVGAIGRALGAARPYILGGLVVIAVIVLILANRPSIPMVLWISFGVLVLAMIVEIFVRAQRLHAPAGHL
jgi:hypothetical protein